MEPFEQYLPLLKSFGVLAAVYVGGVLLTRLSFRLLAWYGRRSEELLLLSIDRNLRRPALYFLPVVLSLAALPLLGFEENVYTATSRVLEILLYLFGAWLITEFIDVLGDLVRSRYDVSVQDNLEERKIITQLAYIKRVTGILVVFLAFAFILLQFDRVKEIGAGLLTSAGVAGIIIGFAAQRSLANLLAGFQIAFTQPVRIDDVVIVENEWGRIEEITLTYIVVRIWDQRRLVLPITYFIEKPFQNWTRSTSELLGTVYIHTDYGMPVEALRRKLFAVLDEDDRWDGRVRNIQVTDAGQDTMEVRALISTRNAGDAWDLRCHVREQLIAFIQEEYPQFLPRTRVEMPDRTEARKA